MQQVPVVIRETQKYIGIIGAEKFNKLVYDLQLKITRRLFITITEEAGRTLMRQSSEMLEESLREEINENVLTSYSN